MGFDIRYENISDDVQKVYIFNEKYPEEEHLVFKIYKSKEKIFFYPKLHSKEKIIFDGFSKLPDIMNEKGYFKAGLSYYIDKKLKEINAKNIIISKNKSSSIRKLKNGTKIIINYDSIKTLSKYLSILFHEAKNERSIAVDDFFAKEFPDQYKSKGITKNKKAKKVINNLDPSIIDILTQDDIDKIMAFFSKLLKSKYNESINKHKLLGLAKLKVDDIAIKQILDEFETLLKKNPHETKWGKFLQKNLYLLDSKYVSIIPELNLVLSTSRKVDFGLIDSQGFLDIFEIKKPTTSLLSQNKDRGNYYWSTDAIKAITQAEKYLYNAISKKDTLAADIKRENNISVKIVKPRVFLLIGNNSQLDNDNKMEDFRILRMSLKNIEIILYDELLERLKNQQNKIYID